MLPHFREALFSFDQQRTIFATRASTHGPGILNFYAALRSAMVPNKMQAAGSRCHWLNDRQHDFSLFVTLCQGIAARPIANKSVGDRGGLAILPRHQHHRGPTLASLAAPFPKAAKAANTRKNEANQV